MPWKNITLRQKLDFLNSSFGKPNIKNIVVGNNTDYLFKYASQSLIQRFQLNGSIEKQTSEGTKHQNTITETTYADKDR